MATFFLAVLVAACVLATCVVVSARARAAEQRCQRGFSEILTAIAGLREQLALTAALRAVPPAAVTAVRDGAQEGAREKGATVARRVVPVTRDDDPVHERPTVEVKSVPPARAVKAAAVKAAAVTVVAVKAVAAKAAPPEEKPAPEAKPAPEERPERVSDGERESVEELTRVLERVERVGGEGAPSGERGTFLEALVDSLDETPPRRSAGVFAAMRGPAAGVSGEEKR